MGVTAKVKRREHQRTDVVIPVEIRLRNFTKCETAVARDISTGGIFLQSTNQTLECDEKICVEINTFKNKVVRLLGTVMWNNHYSGLSNKNGCKGVGVRFTAVDDLLARSWLTSFAGLQS